MVKSSNQQYGTISKILHWTVFLAIAGIFVTGHFAGEELVNSWKIVLLRIHVPLGLSILILTIARIIWWWRADTKPEPLEGTPALQVKIAKLVHLLLYVLPLLMIATGIGMMVLTGAGEELFFKQDGQLPDFTKVPPRFAHGIGAKVLMGLVVLHVAGGLFHHFWMKDKTLKRIWFGR